MINLAFLACIGCGGVSHQVNQTDPIATQVPMFEDWSCSEVSWSPESPVNSAIRINTYDCNMTEGSIYLTRIDGQHTHYKLNKVGECEWKLMLMIEETTCKDIKEVSIVQKY